MQKYKFYHLGAAIFAIVAFSSSSQKFIEEYKKIRVENISHPGAYTTGSRDATLKIVEFFDYLCPYCSTVSKNLKSFAEENPDTVELVFMNLPLDKECNSMVKNDVHPGACKLSYAAYCAGRQNKFHEFHDQLFTLQMYFEVVTQDKISKLANSLKLDMAAFNNCASSKEIRDVIKKQIEVAKKFDIKHTPTVYINGKRLKKMPEKEILNALLQHESF